LFYGFNISRARFNIPAFVAGGIAPFPGIKMVLAGFSPHYFVPGYGKALSGSFMGFNFWHM